MALRMPDSSCRLEIELVLGSIRSAVYANSATMRGIAMKFGMQLPEYYPKLKVYRNLKYLYCIL